MKKLLVVLLAMVMVFAFATSAYAFTDTDDLSTTQQDAIYRLSALGVLNGYPDGTFGADNSITRAEFAKIACIVAGFGEVSDVMANTPSAFSDVAVGMWYTGYVNVAASQGYINGYPDGTFLPNKTISMAEVVTILLRIAGYDDNLPGPWPFDYIAKAGKLDVTDDVTFVSNVPATRADVAVMVNNLLGVVLVNWDSDLTTFVADEDETTVMEDSFDASTMDGVVFYNNYWSNYPVNAWEVTEFDDEGNEITLYFSQWDEEAYYDEDDDEWEEGFVNYNLVMNSDCYISGGNDLTTIAGQEANIIVNDDDEVIYVEVTSTVEYSDDVEGFVFEGEIDVNDDTVDSVPDYAPWFNAFFDHTLSGYAQVIYNEDGEVYSVLDLYGSAFTADDIVVADSWDEDDETVYALDSLSGHDIDLEDTDFVVLKDGEFIDVEDIASGDLIYVMYPYDVDYVVLMVGGFAEGALTEGDDSTITVGDSDYNYYYYDEEHDIEFYSRYVIDGIDGSYEWLEDASVDLEDVYDEDVQVSTDLNPYQLAFLVSDVDASSSTVYGIVTDITVGGLFDTVNDVTILNQDGEEVTYDLDDSDIFTYGAIEATDIELGCYVEVELDEDGVITGANDIILATDEDVEEYSDELTADHDPMTVSSNKINIAGTWYKVNDDTLFFEAVYDGDFDSADFDEANLIDVDDILSADEVSAYACLVSEDTGVLERIYLVNSTIDAGNEGYSFVDRMYTNSAGDFVVMMDGTVAERDGSYEYDTFYSYNVVDGELEVEAIFYTRDGAGAAAAGDPVEDGFWVLGHDVVGGGLAGELADADFASYVTGDFWAELDDFSDDTLTIEGEYYTLTDDTVIYTVDEDGTVDVGDEDDIEDTNSVGVISDEDGNIMYVFVLPMIH